MKKTIFVMLVALLLVSSIASAGVWEKLTGHALFGSAKKANGEVCKTASTCISNYCKLPEGPKTSLTTGVCTGTLAEGAECLNNDQCVSNKCLFPPGPKVAPSPLRGIAGTKGKCAASETASSSETTLQVGKSTSVCDRTVKLVNVGSANIVVEVNGVSKSIGAGATINVNGVLVSVISLDPEAETAVMKLECSSVSTAPAVSGALSECKVYTLPSSLTIDMTGSKYCNGKGYSLCVLQMKGANLADCSNTASGAIVCCK